MAESSDSLVVALDGQMVSLERIVQLDSWLHKGVVVVQGAAIALIQPEPGTEGRSDAWSKNLSVR
jgi:hypothetical protein